MSLNYNSDPSLSSITACDPGVAIPMVGTLIPNRIFVGGISQNTTEEDLRDLFSKYGIVKFVKVIVDRAGVSKGYGFVTFENEEAATLVQNEAENIVLKDRRLNIAAAVKKQFLMRADDTPHVLNGPVVFYHNGALYVYQNPGVSSLTSDTPYNFPQSHVGFPMLYTQPVYLPQQYQYHMISGVPARSVYPPATVHPPGGASAPSTEMYYYVNVPVCSVVPGTPAYVTNQTDTAAPVHILEHTAEASLGTAGEVQKSRLPYSSRPIASSGCVHGSHPNIVSSSRVPCCINNNMSPGAGDARGFMLTENCFHHSQFHLKKVNGVTIMARSTPVIHTNATSFSKSSEAVCNRSNMNVTARPFYSSGYSCKPGPKQN
ncbi:uncharacterized protein LOC143234629 isoform X2 [Tachypleus tridentatus]|uniref:uncharacterized protein LOC143234629 isoform X2 n=1 Tax=Tachypleus tridentatus TaxID=6853 RepID=UPI003FD0BF92